MSRNAHQAESPPTSLGRYLGQTFQGDPYRLAANNAITIRTDPDGQIRADLPILPERTIFGYANKNARMVFINDSHSRWQQRITVAHECGHVLQPGWSERRVEEFTEAFMWFSPTNTMTFKERAAHNRK